MCAAQSKQELHKEKFDSIFMETALKTIYEDNDRAIRIADSLYINNENAELKIRALMLSAFAYRTKGDLKRFFEISFRAEEIADETKNNEWKIRVLGSLSSELRELGLNHQKDLLLNRMNEAILKVDDEEKRNLLLSIYYQEKAFDFFGNYDREYVWNNLKLSEKYLDKIPDGENKLHLKGINQWIYGHTLLALKESPDSALMFTEKAEDYFIQANRPDYLRGILKLNRGRSYFLKNQKDLAYESYLEAEKYTDSLESVVSRMLVYKELQEYYISKNDTVNSFKYLTKYDQLKTVLVNERANPIEALFENIENKKSQLEKKNNLYSFLTYLAIIVLITGLILFFNGKSKVEKNIKKLLEQLENNQKVEIVEEEKDNVKQAFKESINEETYNKIIDGLEKFEKSKGYLKSNLTLADVCSDIKVSTRYLSLYLNQEKGKDFNRYINECRINYIIDKLYKDKDYRKYKLSYLAEECGFSSHAKFSTVFKMFTGVTPSSFVKHLDKNE